jgi:hypothetical protein
MKAVSLLQTTAVRLDSMVEIFSNWVRVTDSLAGSRPDEFSLGRLRNLADAWVEKSSMRIVLETLAGDPAAAAERLPVRYCCLFSTRPRPCTARLMANLVGFVRSFCRI